MPDKIKNIYNELHQIKSPETISQTILGFRVVLAILVLVPTALLHTLKGRGDENLNMQRLKQNQTKHTTLINYLYHQMTPSYAP
jgi:hypothetical protein